MAQYRYNFTGLYFRAYCKDPLPHFPLGSSKLRVCGSNVKGLGFKAKGLE